MVAANPSADHLPLDTFSEKLGPVFVKELRQGLRARSFVAPFLIIHLLAILVVGTQFFIKHFADGSGMPPGMGSLFRFNIFDYSLLILLWLMVGFVMPLTGISALRSELESGRNAELLLMAGLTRWQVIMGKWLVLCALSSLIIISMLPYMFTLYFTGGVELVTQVKQLANVWIFNIVMSAATVGSSGFRHLIGRLATVLLVWASYSFAISIAPTSMNLMTLMGTPLPAKWELLYQAGVVVSQILIIVVYTKYGLQLGRGTLRVFESPMDPPLIGIIFAQICITPWVIGIVHLIGGPIGDIVLLAVLAKIDPCPDKGVKIRPAPTNIPSP